MTYKINAYKECRDSNDNYFTSCDVNDEDASLFRIDYYNRECRFNGNVEVTDRRLAFDILTAMNSAHGIGRNCAFKDIRKLIGVD